MGQMENRTVLAEVKEVMETCNIHEVARLLSSGNWIAILATSEEPYLFALGRISGNDAEIKGRP